MREKPLHLLIVDDDEGIRIPLAYNLKKTYKFQVSTSADAQQAIEMISAVGGNFDVILIDQILDGEMSGLELLKYLRASFPEIQIIVFTGWGMKEEDGLNILNLGAYRYLAKPFNFDELALTIRFAAEQRQMRREKEYLSSLVKVSKELTVTANVKGQLALVWDYVRQQLSTPTFFIGLYESETDTLQFHQSYDLGIPDPIEPRILGNNSSQWGVAGYTIKTGREVIWESLAEAGHLWQEFGIEPVITGEGPSATGICIPLKVGNKVIGVISIQAYQPEAFDHASIDAIRTLAGQLAPAIENAKLFSKLDQTRKHLEGLVGGSFDAAIFIDVHKHITVFNKSAEEMFGYGAGELQGQTVAKLYVDIEQAKAIWTLVEQQEKIVGHTLTLRHRDGSQIQALLSAFLVRDADGSIIGQAGFIRDMRRINQLEKQLRALIQASQAISGPLNTDEILDLIIQSAITAFPATEKGSIHLFDEKNKTLKIRACFGYPRQVIDKATLKPGEGFAGWVFLNQIPIVSGNVQEDPRFRSYSFPELSNQKSTICMPLIVGGKVIGTLSLDNLTRFDAYKVEDVELLSSIAGQAANAIENSRLFGESQTREQLLAALDETSRHIRAEKEPAKLLHEIVRLAAELVGCRIGGLFINYPNIERIELSALHGLPSELIGAQCPYDSPLGQVAQSGDFQIITDYSSLQNRESAFLRFGFKAIIEFPLKFAGMIEAVLFIADDSGEREFNQNDQEILGRFAAQASIALHTSQLMNKGNRRFSQLVILHRISEYIQEKRDIDKVLHVGLTGITAGYGLGFNRAGLFILNEAGTILTGKMGIGFLNDTEARADWLSHIHRGLEDFGRYIVLAERGEFSPTPVDVSIRQLSLDIGRDISDAFSRAVIEQHFQLVSSTDLAALPKDFQETFKPELPFIIIPLIAQDQVIGLLVADNKFTHAPITQEDIDSLITFANTMALAIDTTRLIEREQNAARRMKRHADRLKVLHQVGTEITAARDLDQIWDSIAEHVIQLVGARQSLFLLVNTEGKRLLKATGQGYLKDQLEKITYDDFEIGLTGWVLRNKRALLISSTGIQNEEPDPSLQEILEREAAPTIVAPLIIKDEVIGTLTVANSIGDPAFNEDDKELVVMFASQAASAYDNARRMHELKQFQKAADALASVLEPTPVLQQIVDSACDILQADSSAVWSFDNVLNRTIPDELVAHGIPKNELMRLKKKEKSQNGTAETIMKAKWVGVQDISDPRYSFIGPSTMEMLKRIGTRSFVGIALRAGDENLGVLYVNFKKPRKFSTQDRRILETFANQAALALKKARLSSLVKRARDAATVIAQIVALGRDSLNDWNENVKLIMNALPCNAVTLYRYNEDTDELYYPPAMAGVKFIDAATRLPSIPKHSFVRSVLRNGRRLIIKNTQTHPRTRKKRFTREEDIKSLIALPLTAGNRKVGIMFVNYHNIHHFTDDELRHIDLFSNQIAIAIRNSQLHEQAHKQAQMLEGLYEAGQAVTGVLSLNEILVRLAERAWHLVGQSVSYSVIRMVQNETARVMATYPPEELDHRLAMIPSVDLVHGHNGKIGVTGRAIKTFEPQLANDTNLDKDYIPSHPEIRAELAVPIILGQQVMGSINVDSTEVGAFTLDDIQALVALASYAAIAINNAQLHEKIQRHAETLSWLYDAGKSITSSLALDEVLTHICENALKILMADPIQGCFSHVGLLSNNQLQFIASYPQGILTDLEKRIGVINIVGSMHLGIAGRAVRTGLTQQVDNVTKDPDYIALRNNINSQLSVPLKIGQNVIGVLSIEHPEIAAFSPAEIKNVELLTSQAAVALQNAQRYEELDKMYKTLQETQDSLVGQTILAWTGMISSTWGHSVRKHAITIEEQLQLIREDIPSMLKTDQLNERFNMIDRLAKMIHEKRITPPLKTEDSVSSVPINDLIRERTKQLWENRPHNEVKLNLDLNIDDMATVRTSPDWLQRALDILIENAVEATAGRAIRKVSISTKANDHSVEILISDNGYGISAQIQNKIFKERIEKPVGSEGQGIGLLFVNTIVQTYGGKVACRKTNGHGTTMAMTLPLEIP